MQLPSCDACRDFLKWSAIGSGVLSLGAGLRSYVHFLGNTVSIPMQFGFLGNPTWSVQTPHGFLVYPLTSVFLTGAVIAISRSDPMSKKINYPCSFPEEQRKEQFQLMTNYINSIALVTNAFLFTLSSKFVPEIVAGSRGALPQGLVAPFCLSLGALTAVYYYVSKKKAHQE